MGELWAVRLKQPDVQLAVPSKVHAEELTRVLAMAGIQSAPELWAGTPIDHDFDNAASESLAEQHQ